MSRVGVGKNRKEVAIRSLKKIQKIFKESGVPKRKIDLLVDVTR